MSYIMTQSIETQICSFISGIFNRFNQLFRCFSVPLTSFRKIDELFRDEIDLSARKYVLKCRNQALFSQNQFLLLLFSLVLGFVAVSLRLIGNQFTTGGRDDFTLV